MKTPPPNTAFPIASRRHWARTSLFTCGYLATSSLLTRADDDPVPPGYTPPGPVTTRGHAPGVRSRLLVQSSAGERTYAVIFAKGDEVMSGLTEFAERERIGAAHFTAIGALQSARFGWFDREQKSYRDIPIAHQVELISLIGDIGLVNDAPQIHAHGSVGFPDGRMQGGHLLEAIVWPTLEVFLTAFPTPLIKKHDPETNLSFFDVPP